jgi:regulator of sigma E protease
MYIVIAILAFGFLIAIHEFGHFIFAKLFHVKVNEFSIGMGPQLLKKQGKETMYSLRLLPIGGYCSMEGEDEELDDPRAFTSRPAWQRAIILAAGAFMNFLVGFIIVVCLMANATGFIEPTITELADGFPYESQLMVGDTIYKIDGSRVYNSSDFSTYMSLADDDTVDMVIIRNGEKIKLNDFKFEKHEYDDGEGGTTLRYGVTFKYAEATGLAKLKNSWYTTVDFVRNVILSLKGLLTGKYGVSDLSGPVGIVSTINEVGETADSVKDALYTIFYLCAFIAVNLAVMNMLPIPALDGGRIFFLIVTVIIEAIIRRKLNPKYEGYIHAAGMVLLLALMAFVMFNDIVRIVKG